ncbi:MAG TPA: hypothetical protein VGC10_10880 [Sphingomonas sp.]
MSTAALEALLREQRALLAALDGDDIEAIARHTAGMDDALVRIRALSPRMTGGDARKLAEEAVTLNDAARVRVNVLADRTSRRMARLAAATGKGNAAPVYGRTGRLSR